MTDHAVTFKGSGWILCINPKEFFLGDKYNIKPITITALKAFFRLYWSKMPVTYGNMTALLDLAGYINSTDDPRAEKIRDTFNAECAHYKLDRELADYD